MTLLEKYLCLYRAPIGILANGAAQAYNVSVFTSTGYFAVKNAAGVATIYASGVRSVPASPFIVFWACAGSSNATASGTVSMVNAQGNQLNFVDISRLKSLTSLWLNSNVFAALLLGTNGIISFYCNTNANLTQLNTRGLTTAQMLDVSSTSLASVDVSGMGNLNYLYVRNTPMTTSAAALNALYTSLPNLPTGSHYLFVGAGAATGSDTSIATAKHWTVLFS